jgi:hypothetical protein
MIETTSFDVHCGRICMGRRKINLSIVFAGQNVGVREVADKIWLVSFMGYDLGFFDQECGRVTSAENAFDARVLPMCPAVSVKIVVARFKRPPVKLH